MDIDVTVSGERSVSALFKELPDRVRARLVAPITSLTTRLLAAVHAQEPKRTGRLESETQMRITETTNAVRGQVFIAANSSTEHGKAGALEFGAHRRVDVSSYHRSGHTPLGAPADQVVRAYSRQANIVAQRFERGPLDRMRPEIIKELEEAIHGF